jgi:hypothetical protein
MLKVVNDHGTYRGLDEVFVLESLAFFELQTQDDLVGLKEGHLSLFNLLEPRQHGVDVSWEYDTLLGDLWATVSHDSVVDDRVGQFKDILVHTILLFKDSRTRWVFLAQLLEQAESHAFLLGQDGLDQGVELIVVADHNELIG